MARIPKIMLGLIPEEWFRRLVTVAFETGCRPLLPARSEGQFGPEAQGATVRLRTARDKTFIAVGNVTAIEISDHVLLNINVALT